MEYDTTAVKTWLNQSLVQLILTRERYLTPHFVQNTARYKFFVTYTRNARVKIQPSSQNVPRNLFVSLFLPIHCPKTKLGASITTVQSPKIMQKV